MRDEDDDQNIHYLWSQNLYLPIDDHLKVYDITY